MAEQPTSRRSATSGTATAGSDAPVDTQTDAQTDTQTDTQDDTRTDTKDEAGNVSVSGAVRPTRTRPVLDVRRDESVGSPTLRDSHSDDSTSDHLTSDGAASDDTASLATARARRSIPVVTPTDRPADTDTAPDPTAASDDPAGPDGSGPVSSAPDVPVAQRAAAIRGPRPRVRRVTRVIRHIDTWTVFKVALIFHLVLYVSFLVSAVLLWNVAHGTGTVDNVERFMETFGWETFRFDGGQMFDAAWRIGLFLVVGLTGLAVLAATTFNLITDIVGGVRVTVLEEEVLARPVATPDDRTPRRGRRRGRSHRG